MTKKITIIDPPSGWKYGFPRPVPEEYFNKGFDLKAWLVSVGYPQEEINICGNHFYCRLWEHEIGPEDV